MPLDDRRIVTFMDVGQGDCTLITDEDDSRGLLIDCTASAVRRVLARIRDLGVKELDVLITHWDSDHYCGAVRIARSFPARKVYFNIDTTTVAEDSAIKNRRRLALEGVAELDRMGTILKPADDAQLGQIGSVSWKLLAPTHAELLSAILANDRNHASAVIVVEGAGATALIGGDADGRTLSRIIASGTMPSSVKVLRCSHHGGALDGEPGAIDESRLYRAVKPDILVISTGTRNTYGHPHASWINEATNSGIRVMCTQATPRCGAVPVADHPCAGNIALHLDSGRVSPDVEKHERSMRSLIPLCRPDLALADNPRA